MQKACRSVLLTLLAFVAVSKWCMWYKFTTLSFINHIQ